MNSNIPTIPEMRLKAKKFCEEHKNDSNEKGQAQLYWRDFFDIFGINIKDVAHFEEAVKKFDNSQGFIDLFWKGKLVIEHKSRGKNLTKAYNQAVGYLDTLSSDEKPRYIIVSDFYKIKVTDIINKKEKTITIDELHKTENIELFKFIYEHGKIKHEPEKDLNDKAAELMASLHDGLKENNYPEEDLEKLLTRILFCLYAEDTRIFNRYQFTDLIEHEEPINVGQKIITLFRTLDKKENERQIDLPEEYKCFPYVNGNLFKEKLDTPIFNKKLHITLIKACHFDWSTISPAIFGSLFQYVIDEELRSKTGAHYTSESNVLKVINSLFMNDLWDEFRDAGNNKRKLEILRNKLGYLRFLDPACGCGNFLIIAYRELRLLEYEILIKLFKGGKTQTRFFASEISVIRIEHFYGIELNESAVNIARIAMWFVEHQMNLKFDNIDIHENNLPLKKQAEIIQENALRIDWSKILEPSNNVIVLGNPPFVGKSKQTKIQKEDMGIVFEGYKYYKNLDYVSGWYKKALDYIQETDIPVGFVSTNSICQGEHVILLWKFLHENYKFHINFAHQSFKWSNEAKNKAGVHVCIIGFSCKNKENKYLFTYKTPTSTPIMRKVNYINSYLLDFEEIFIKYKRLKPISNIPEIKWGSKPVENGYLILSSEEKKELIKKNKSVEKFIKPLIGANEFIKGKKRYCIWLNEVNPKEYMNIPEITDRLDKIRNYRKKSKKKSTREKLSKTPELFGEIRQPKAEFVIIPETSSGKREYIPIGFLTPDNIVNNRCYYIENADLYVFGVLTSKMHMVWINIVGGKLGSGFTYSGMLIYNNYPFPMEVSKKNKDNVMKYAQEVLDVRNKYSDSTLADLYGEYMPVDLVKAHDKLDKSVDKCYRSKKFVDDNDRMEFLNELYLKYTRKEV